MVGVDPEGLAAATAALSEGAVVGIPTDTVYGIAVALAAGAPATRALFAAKQRPHDVDLPVLVADLDQAETLGILGPMGRVLAAYFWPGPLTLVVPRRPGMDADLGSRSGTIGLRVPAHPVPISLCWAAGPLATTSANLHGHPPATTATGVVAQLRTGGLAVVIDGGTCAGAPSTVVAVTGDELTILREGAIGLRSLRSALWDSE